MLNSGEKGRLIPTDRKNKDMEAEHQGEPGKARGKKSRDGESQGYSAPGRRGLWIGVGCSALPSR